MDRLLSTTTDAIRQTGGRGRSPRATEGADHYTWLGADAAAREKSLKSGPSDASGLVPAVVFLHGCAGRGADQERVMGTIHRKGYVVFAPDSFARPERVKLCGKGSRWERVGLRLAEASYALAKVRQLRWIDAERLILAGFSEGGSDAWRKRRKT